MFLSDKVSPAASCLAGVWNHVYQFYGVDFIKHSQKNLRNFKIGEEEAENMSAYIM